MLFFNGESNNFDYSLQCCHVSKAFYCFFEAIEVHLKFANTFKPICCAQACLFA